jgi:6-phosphogluconolactonase
MTFKLILFCLFTALFSCSNPNVPLHVGTYTNGDSKGIYQFQFNTKTGKLTNKVLAATTENPSFITYSPNKKYIYAVNETDTGEVSAFKVEEDNTLTFLNKVSSNGAHPCHISINATGSIAAVSNYTGGNASLYNINTNGVLPEAFQILNQNTDSIVSHVHSAQFFNDNLYVSDLGKNAIYNYEFQNGNYRLKDLTIINHAKNAGPRHFSISKNGKYIYSINEYGSSVTSLKKTGSGFKQIDVDSTLDENYKGENYCADIHLSKNEQFLYGSNRGENSIAVFKRNTTNGTINKIQNISVQGDWPRNFTLDPTENFLLVANQRSHNISVFKIDANTGKLTFLHDTKTPSPVCLLF